MTTLPAVRATEPVASMSSPASGTDDTADLAPARRALGRVSVQSVAPVVTFAIAIGIWYLFALVLMSPRRRFLVPTPHRVWQASFADGANRADMLDALWVTTKVSLSGLAIATMIGVTIAVAMSLAAWVEASLYPYAILIQVVPILAIVPLLGLLFGFGFRSRVIVCVMISLFPIITNTLFGLKSADRGMHELFTLAGVSRAKRLWKLQFPAALPSIFTGLRIAAGASVIGAVVGDFFFQRGEAGLGVLLRVYSTQLLTPQLYGVVVLCSLLGVAIFGVFTLAARLTIGAWHRPVTK